MFEGRWRGVFIPNLTPEEMFKGGGVRRSFFWSASPNDHSMYLLMTA